jgi:hypothetical protein
MWAVSLRLNNDSKFFVDRLCWWIIQPRYECVRSVQNIFHLYIYIVYKYNKFCVTTHLYFHGNIKWKYIIKTVYLRSRTWWGEYFMCTRVSSHWYYTHCCTCIITFHKLPDNATVTVTLPPRHITYML